MLNALHLAPALNLGLAPIYGLYHVAVYFPPYSSAIPLLYLEPSVPFSLV